MNSLTSLLGMVCTEAIGDGLPTDHYFDEMKDPNYDRKIPDYDVHMSAGIEPPAKGSAEPELPPIHFRLELIEGEDGKLYWVE